MATAVTASYPICNRSYEHSFTYSSISHTFNFLPQQQRPFSPKPINLIKSQFFTSFPPRPHHLQFHQHPFVSFNGFQATEQDHEPETMEKLEPKKLPNSNQKGRLFVGNLPYSSYSSQLAQLFGEAGVVVSVEIVYDEITDRSRGFAFVTMESVEDAQQAIQMFDGYQVGGRTIKVNFPEVPKGGEGLVMGSKVSSNYKGFVDSLHKIYAGNLHWGLTSQGLRDAFSCQRGFLSAKVIYERGTGKSRGYGFVSFETAEDVEAAMSAMNGVEVQGRPLRLNLAADKKPTSPPVIDENTRSKVVSLEMLFNVRT